MSLHNIPSEPVELISDNIKLIILTFYKDFAGGQIKLRFEKGKVVILYRTTAAQSEFWPFPIEYEADWLRKAEKYGLTVDMFSMEKHVQRIEHQ